MRLRHFLLVAVILCAAAAAGYYFLIRPTPSQDIATSLPPTPVERFEQANAEALFGVGQNTRVRFFGLGGEVFAPILAEMPEGSTARPAPLGEPADVRFIGVLDWAQLPQIRGAEELCGDACTDDTWLVRLFIRREDGTLQKTVLLNFQNFVTIQSNAFFFSAPGSFDCLTTRLSDEILYVLGDGLSRDCHEALPPLGTERTLVSWTD